MAQENYQIIFEREHIANNNIEIQKELTCDKFLWNNQAFTPGLHFAISEVCQEKSRSFEVSLEKNILISHSRTQPDCF